YSCAYQREILCQGRMYISQRHICFYANIFGWETNLVVPVSEIAAITKEKAAKIFPNSIQVSRGLWIVAGRKEGNYTNLVLQYPKNSKGKFQIEMKDETRYFFASFVNREKSLTVLLKVLEKVQMDEENNGACKSYMQRSIDIIDR
ncbi:GRAM domain protein, partial [Ancylostoma duodenale]